MPKYIFIGPQPISKKLKLDQRYSIFFIDGGLNHNTFLKQQQFTSIGDGDSSETKLHLKLPQEKSRSDLHHAFELIKEQFSTVYLHGFQGGRLDHYLFNIGESFNFSETKELTIHFFDQFNQKILSIHPKGLTNIDYKGCFSLASLTKQNITIKGQAKYNGSFKLESLSSQGLSNESSGKFQLIHSQPLAIFY